MKRVFSILLVIIMTVSVLSVGAFATVDVAQEIEAEVAPTSGIMPLHETVVSSWSSLVDAVMNSTYDIIRLESNITAPASSPAILIAGGREVTVTSAYPGTFTITHTSARHFVINHGRLTLKNVVLCGGGAAGGVEFGTATASPRKLVMEGGSVIENSVAAQGGGVFVQNGGVFVMNGGEIRYNSATVLSGNGGGGVNVTGGSTFVMNGGTIVRNDANAQGGGIRIAGSTFKMRNGVVRDNFANTGGGVLLQGSTFVLKNGTISGNTAQNSGGGIHLAGSTVFTMHSGTIRRNTAYYGGGVLVNNGASFVMKGGVLCRNTATTSGGGIRVWGDRATFTMTNGEIFENDAAVFGGGVFVTAGTVTMKGGTIHTNTAANGGGISVRSGGTFEMEDGTVRNNFAISGGGVHIGGTGIAITDYGVFEMTGGIIESNDADNGGGIWLGGARQGNSLTITNGTIRNNTAISDGGGIFAHMPNFADPVPQTAYPRITSIGADVIFSGNSVGNGAFRPSRVTDILGRISTTSATLFGHPINNYDINFQNNNPIEELTATFVTNPTHGSFEPPADAPDEHEVTFELDIDNMPFHLDPQGDIPVVDNVDGFRHIGWVVGGSPDVLLTCEEIADMTIIDDITFIAQFEVRVRFIATSGGTLDGETVVWLHLGTPLAATDIPTPTANQGFRFTGWSPNNPNVAGSITEPTTFTAQFQQINGDPGGRNIYVRFLWNYAGNDGTFHLKAISPGSMATPPAPPTREGYTFRGWYLEPTASNIHDFDNQVHRYLRLYAGWDADYDDNGNGPFSPYHNSFMIGRPSGNIYPRDNVRRSEVAAVLFRLLSDEVRIEMWSQENTFTDVNSSHWFNNEVSTITNMGVIRGLPDGTFAPNRAVTRAELAAIIARFFDETNDNGMAFTDIAGHWAEDYINQLAHMGWVQGHSDGTFRPDQPVTRAAFAAIICRMLDRVPDSVDALLDGRTQWPDKTDQTAWYYLYMQEASHSTEFERLPNGYLAWTEILEHIDWSAFSRSDSRPDDILVSREQ